MSVPASPGRQAPERRAAGTQAARVVRVADFAGTFVFAVEGALEAMKAGFDPIGILVLAFITALGGGVVRDLMIGAIPPAAVRDGKYALVVIAAACVTFLFHPATQVIPRDVLVALDAAGLSLFAVAGTEKALEYGIHPLPSVFLGAIGGVGGGTFRDLLLNQIPRVLRIDIYATAALAAAAIVATGYVLRLPPRRIAIIAALTCFGLRLIAVWQHWQLPKAV